MKEKVFYYKGAVHIHTKFSDGTGDINEISKAAKLAGLDWIIITDHNCMAVEEGFYNGVCVIKGEEISPEKSDHYLALGIKTTILPDKTPQQYVNEVREQGGFGFAAHPDETDSRKNTAKPIRWTDKSIIPDGIEIWNWFSSWADNYDETNIFTILYSYIFRHNLVKAPHEQTLKWWDDLNNNSSKSVPAISGVDAHALKISKYVLPVTVFPYKSSFKTLTNIITLKNKMPENFQEQKEIILDALRNANNIIINRHVRDESPYISCIDGVFKIKVNVKAEIKIIFNGSVIYRTCAIESEFKCSKSGKYRAEIYLRNKPWIYTNYFVM